MFRTSISMFRVTITCNHWPCHTERNISDLEMHRILRRLHGTIGPAVLNSTFVGVARVPECYLRPHFGRAKGTRSLPPLFFPSFPSAFPLFLPSFPASPLPPSSNPADRRESSGTSGAIGPAGNFGRSKNTEFTLISGSLGGWV